MIPIRNWQPTPFALDADDELFRQEVRAFVAANLHPDLASRVRRTSHISRQDVSTWMGLLHRHGWSAVGWPVEHGGRGWSGLRRIIFEEECMAADAPPQHFANINSVGPIIYTFGTEAQKQRFLEPLLNGNEIWCQGFSEPNAGSDLSALKTSAVLEGDEYVVNGQKIWTSDAQHADWMFALIRTDSTVAAHKGISFLLIDMKTLGLTVRPIRLIDGSQVVNEVFFDSVRVPRSQLVGQPGDGWSFAKFLLANERSFSAEVPLTKRDFKRVMQLAMSTRSGQGRLWDDPLFRARVIRFQVDLEALEFLMLRALNEGTHHASDLASLLKIPGAELRQRASELLAEACFPHGLVRYPDVYTTASDARMPGPVEAQGVSEMFAYRRATTIYGGSSEIQRNIIARSMLGGKARN
jgi:alkylation response protein AidB-like acyl-CoA dehydrogenase